jgi:hypothetical protein
MNIVLSFPRSGSHLVRSIIEYYSGRCTIGCNGMTHDVNADPPICMKADAGYEHVSLSNPIAHKRHFTHKLPAKIDSLMLIHRTPKEALLSFEKPQYAKLIGETQTEEDWKRFEYLCELFTANIQTYNQYAGPKMIVKYEDLVFGHDDDKLEITQSILSFYEVNPVKPLNSETLNIVYGIGKSVLSRRASSKTKNQYADLLKSKSPSNMSRIDDMIIRHGLDK